ncbi:MAG: hypothetical protein ACREQE_05705, partial [Candidatus Binataceae bacterium]
SIVRDGVVVAAISWAGGDARGEVSRPARFRFDDAHPASAAERINVTTNHPCEVDTWIVREK